MRKSSSKRGELWRVLFLSVMVVGLSLGAAAQAAKTDPSSVKTTIVPHMGLAPSASVSTTGAGNPAKAAAFGGSPYAVGPVITPTTTGPEAEEHIAVDPNNSNNLVSTISDFSRPLDGFLVNTTKFATSIDNGASWHESFVTQAKDGRPKTS